MKFSDSFLDEIRARLPVSQGVSRRVQLKRAGREWTGLSPFNREKTPSFTVNDQKGFYHCFSSGKHGDVFTFVMETEGLSFPEAVERLAGEQMPLAGLVVNRASQLSVDGLSADQALAAAERLDAHPDGTGSSAVTAGLLRLHADRSRIVAREHHLRQRFAAAHPHVPTAVMPALSTDVHDLDGLRRVGQLISR